MSYYHPDPKIPNFIFKLSERTLYMKCQVEVLLPRKDDLKDYSIVYSGIITQVDKTYDHKPDPARLTDKTYQDEFNVKILENVNIPYDPRDPEAFKNELRTRMADYYSLNAIILPLPSIPDTGGSNATSAHKSEEILIT